MRADPKTEAEVIAVLERLAEAYNSRDGDAVMAVYADDADLVLFGSGVDERCIGRREVRAQFERDMAQSESAEMKRTWASVSASGPVAWAACEYMASWRAGGQSGVIPLVRWTVVMERRQGRWLIVHMHVAIPPSEQAEGQSWPTPIEAIASAVGQERPDLRAQAAPDGTVTVLFTDIENSTNLTERLGDIQWLEVLRQHNAIVREQLESHSCFEVKSQGDGFMIASQSARRAVRCAIGIQERLARYNEKAPEPIQVRMGLHTGEVLKDADDFFGKHVILASRIAGKARGGEILVSSLLRDLTESAGDIAFGDPRDVELRGLAGTYQVYGVHWRNP
ncbi:MAG TPA: adenylate/guanylate cyclase domain-containing protein [Dehalococcoidia bacterium]|nr:adenylate/guanylate cyclase domain-containing protein [Dehalococcoidia bacterium]